MAIKNYKIALFIIILNIFCVIKPPVYAQETYTGPVMGMVSSGFGARSDPFTGITREHDGIDIAAPYGAPIYAMQDGVVIKSGYRGGYGLALTIDHYYPDIPSFPRLQITYGHSSYLMVKTGDHVKKGQVIALVGSTGRSTGPHLHFEVKYQGKYCDPIEYLKKYPSYMAYLDNYRKRIGSSSTSGYYR